VPGHGPDGFRPDGVQGARGVQVVHQFVCVVVRGGASVTGGASGSGPRSVGSSPVIRTSSFHRVDRARAR